MFTIENHGYTMYCFPIRNSRCLETFTVNKNDEIVDSQISINEDIERLLQNQRNIDLGVY